MKKEDKMIIYQVLPRLFGNDRDKNSKNGTLKENGSGKLSAFSEKALSEIRSMGFTHIWYTGLIEHATKTDYSAYGISNDHPAVVKGNAGSPYAIKDYYDIDPDLADRVGHRMKEFEALVERTHVAGLKMILDFVPNHVARQYHSDAKPEGVIDLGENDNIHTTYRSDNNFYYIPGQAFSPEFDLTVDGVTYEENPARATGNDRFDAHPTRNDWYETIKLNYGIDYLNWGAKHFDPVPDTWYKMRDILLFWASKKVDGFRCDMAEMVPVEFWGWVIPAVKSEFPAVVFIAEVYNPEQYRNYLSNGCFDYLYDKVGLYDTLRAIVCGNQSVAAITHCWQSVHDIQPRMLNFLENHDEQRIASDFFARDPERALPAMVVSATMNVNPVMIYSGQELGESGMEEEGFSGRDGRTTIFDYWSVESIRNWRNKDLYDGKKLTEAQQRLRNWYIRLLQLCNKEKALSNGLFYDLMYANYENTRFNSDRQFAFMRHSGNSILLIVVNFNDAGMDTEVFIPAHLFEYFQIGNRTIIPGKELLTGEKITEAFGKDSLYPVYIEKYSAKILKFTIAK